MRYTALASLLTLLVGFSDAAPTAPVAPPAADQKPDSLARLALADALDRIVPSYLPGSASTELRSVLIVALERPGSVSLRVVESAAERLRAELPPPPRS